MHEKWYVGQKISHDAKPHYVADAAADRSSDRGSDRGPNLGPNRGPDREQ